MKAVTRSKGPRIGPRLAQFFRFAFGLVFALVLMVGALASGALEKPNGKPLRLVDVYYWAFGYPADDRDILRTAPTPIALPNDAPPPTPAVIEPPKPPVPVPPKEQTQFTVIVTRYSVSFGGAVNQSAQRKLRAERAAALCQQMKERSVTDWVGTVDEKGSDAGGNGFLYLDIGGAQVGTAVSAAADVTNKTMILRDSVLSTIAGNLKPGQTVLFTGELFSDRLDCIKQANATAANAITKPRFLVKFTNLRGF